MLLTVDESGRVVVPDAAVPGAANDAAAAAAADLARFLATSLRVRTIDVDVDAHGDVRVGVTVQESGAAGEWSTDGRATASEAGHAAVGAVLEAVLDRDNVPIAALKRLSAAGAVTGAVVRTPSSGTLAVGDDAEAGALVRLLGCVPPRCRLDVETDAGQYRAVRRGAVGLACRVAETGAAVVDDWLASFCPPGQA
jgi:hypothetical protein